MAATAQAMDVHCWGVPSSGPGVAGYQGRTLAATQLLLRGAHARIGPFDCRSGAVRLSDSERDLLDASSARWSTRCISGINNHGYKHPSISIVSFFPQRAAAAALFPCPFVFAADSSPFLFKSGLAQRQSAQHMSLSSGQMCLASSICPLPESASPCPLPTTKGCFLTWHQGPGQSILWFSGWGHHCVQRRLQIYPSRRGDLPCTVALGTFSKLSEAFRTQPGYGRGYSGKPLTQSREPMASRGRQGQHEGISS